MIDLIELMNNTPDNLTIYDAISKCYTEVRNHDKILVSISGGSDSDEMLDMIIRCGGKDKSIFVFFNTGLEYTATKRHIKYLELKYGITIHTVPPVKPIPTCVKDYGVPFWSKQVSEMIGRLQKHNFQWEDEPFEVLLKKYPKCKAALKWWCNEWGEGGKKSAFNIAYVRGLKEFMIAYPPNFKISNKCCHYAKKLPAKKFKESAGCDLNCVGIRKSEGGARSLRYSNCFTSVACGADEFRPLFWFTDKDKVEYDQHYNITHSDCYKIWGMKRTGCSGCPFARNYEDELKLAKQYEPNFYKAMTKVFGKSYEYRRKFEKFRSELKQ